MSDIYEINDESDIEEFFNWLIGVNSCMCHIGKNELPGILSENAIYSVIGTLQWGSTSEVQAAMLLRSLTLNHGFKDGNKRTAVIAANRIKPFTCSDDACIDGVVKIARGELKDVNEIRNIIFGSE